MGITLNRVIARYWKKECTIAFVSTFIFGLLVHIYKFTNNLPNHDSVYNFYNDQNLIGSGRWLLSIACGFSSYFDLPWINGLFSLIFISLTTVVIIRLFEIVNSTIICLISGLMVSFPSITEILCFGFTADGFFMAMLLSALSVYIIKCFNNRIMSVVFSTLLICFSCGIYQSYVSFAIVLFICYYLWILIEKDCSNKEYSSYLIRFIISLVIGLALYYCIWKICLGIQGATPTDYQGINQIGVLSIKGIIQAIKSICNTWISFILEKNIFKHGISLYALLNVLFIIVGFVAFVFVIFKQKIYKNRFKMISTLLCIAAIPFVVCMWQFISPEVVYGYRMLNSIVLLYIFCLLLFDKHMKSIFANAYSILIIIMIINLSVCANIAYYYLNYEYEKSYAEAVSLEYMLNKEVAQTDGKYKIAIIGNREKEVALDLKSEANKAYMYTSKIEKSLLTDSNHTEQFLSNVLYFDGEYADSKTKAEIEQTEEYQNMTPWFEGGDLSVINDTIVVKLG